MLFDTAADAVAYALAYHRAIAPFGLRARAGVHVGPVLMRTNSPADVARGAKPLEVEGLAKPIAARVMSLALAGQTLLTAEAADALALRRVQAGPDGAVAASGDPVLQSHGHWMLKGLLAPVPLYEVGVPGEAPMIPPQDTSKAWRVVWRNEAWVPLRDVKHGLPRERDAFIGREADLKALAHRLDEGAALVSVLGIGGTGKTRLVTHHAWTWLGSWPGGAWFCDLSEARSVDGIAGAVARALDVPLGKDDPIVQLGHAIAGRGKCLVILDNFEQVARHAPATLGHWLDRASEAQFVVTTREVLGLPGEVALALAPLREAEAVDLFVARAIQAKRDFALSDADRPHVLALVKLLDGLRASASGSRASGLDGSARRGVRSPESRRAIARVLRRSCRASSPAGLRPAPRRDALAQLEGGGGHFQPRTGQLDTWGRACSCHNAMSPVKT
jgi:hypothetical protein